jgi:integrase
MALFKVNTGTRDKEVCYLRWEWEVPVPELGTSVFIIPEDRVKNGEERLLVLSRVAISVIEEVRGEHPEHVFTYRDHPIALFLITIGYRDVRCRISDDKALPSTTCTGSNMMTWRPPLHTDLLMQEAKRYAASSAKGCMSLPLPLILK